MSHVWKYRSYNLDFRASQGQILPPRRKLSRMKMEKREKNQNVVQQKANLNTQFFGMHGWVNLAGLSLTRKARQWNAMFAQMPICSHAWTDCCTTFWFFRKTSMLMKSLKKLMSCSKERRAGNLEKLATAADLLSLESKGEDQTDYIMSNLVLQTQCFVTCPIS